MGSPGEDYSHGYLHHRPAEYPYYGQPPPPYPPQQFDPFAPNPHFPAASQPFGPSFQPLPPPVYPPPSYDGGPHSVYPPVAYPPPSYQPSYPPPFSSTSTHHQHMYSPPVHQYSRTEEDCGCLERLSSHSLGVQTNVELPKGQLVRIFSNSAHNLNLTASRDGSVKMATANSQDELQQWIRDDSHGIRIRDSYGHPAFMLINKGCKNVLKYTSTQVLLVNYSPGMEDEDLLWTESQDFGEGFKTLRKASDPLFNLTILHGETKTGGVKEGSKLVLDTWHKKDHQLWKIFPL